MRRDSIDEPTKDASWEAAIILLSCENTYKQGPNFDDMSSFFSCDIDDEIQYSILGYGAQATKIVIL